MLLARMQGIEAVNGADLLFRLDRLEIYEHDIIGVTGKNGSGKTTLLNMLAGRRAPDAGTVSAYASLSYLEQFTGEAPQGGLSGGEITKAYLSEALGAGAPLLLLDEPTSNLDISAIRLLEKQILGYNGGIVLISHDRKLLENCCTKILDIENQEARLYDCGYADFVSLKQQEAERGQFLYEQYNKERRRLLESIRETQAKSKSVRKAPKRMGNSEARLHKRKAGERMESVEAGANALKTRLEKLEVHKQPKKQRRIGIGLENISERYRGRFIIECEGLSVGFGERILFENAAFRIKTGAKVILIGDNGCGKTTLIKKILEPGVAEIKSHAKNIAYYSQGLDMLDTGASILANVLDGSAFTELEARNILGRLDIRRDAVGKRVGYISGGERVKVCFAKIFTQGADLIILDEPTNYLDISTAQALEDIIKEYDGTVLAVSHDRSFAGNISDCVLEIKNRRVEYRAAKFGHELKI